MSFQLNYAKSGIWSGKFSSFPNHIVNHAISTKFGGTSKNEYSSMNLAMHNGDQLERVIQNRILFCKANQFDYKKIITAEQVHGDEILYVDEKNAGSGYDSYESALKHTDALITNCKGIPLMLFFADCVPVLFVDPIHKAIGISHAGWKGTAQKIAQKTVLKMMDNFGTNPAECLVGIGPSIGACCYEVDCYVSDKFELSFGDRVKEILTPEKDKWKLDLWKANIIQLIDIGVKIENIDHSNVCTNCNSEVFFSYRADKGKTGRIAALICLK